MSGPNYRTQRHCTASSPKHHVNLQHNVIFNNSTENMSICRAGRVPPLAVRGSGTLDKINCYDMTVKKSRRQLVQPLFNITLA